MGRSQESFNKRDREKKRQKKREEKEKKRLERKENNLKGAGLDSMITYIDQFGNPTDVPPEEQNRDEVEAEEIVLGIPPKEEGDDEGLGNTGRVDFFDNSKGFGFIKHDHSPEKYFVHITACVDEITEGDKVAFELERGPKGMSAVNVKKTE